jgi:hypothetical protein
MASTKPKPSCPRCGKPTEEYLDWMRSTRVRWCGGCAWEHDVPKEGKYRKNGEKLTWRMRFCEETYCPEEGLAAWLPDKINELGLAGAARLMGLNCTTLGNWCDQLGIQHRYVAIPPGHRIEFVKEW